MTPVATQDVPVKTIVEDSVVVLTPVVVFTPVVVLTTDEVVLADDGLVLAVVVVVVCRPNILSKNPFELVLAVAAAAAATEVGANAPVLRMAQAEASVV